MVRFLDEKRLDWVFQSKGSRKIKIKGRWTTLEEIDLSYTDSRIFTISGNAYSVWETEGKMKGIGSVKAVFQRGLTAGDTISRTVKSGQQGRYWEHTCNAGG